MKGLRLRDLARATGLSEGELFVKLVGMGFPVQDGRVPIREWRSVQETLTLSLLRIRDHAAETEEEALRKLERDCPLTDGAAKAIELARRLARDMGHPAVAGLHVLLGLTMVADPELEDVPSLAEISRRSLMDAAGESEELADAWLSFKDRTSTLAQILSRARKSCSGGRVDAMDLLAAALSGSTTARVLARAGVEVATLEDEVGSAHRRRTLQPVA